jgi:hypothetical protein
MKKHPSYIVSIPTPCHESWDAMTAAEQGRFCQNCQKIVTDFSRMSDAEIISFFSTGQDHICGRFDPTQLNRPLQQAVVDKQSRKPLAAIITLITALTILIPSARAQKKTGQIYVAPDKKPKSDTTITDTDSTDFKRTEISSLGVNKKYLPKKIDASLNSNS